MIYSVSTKKENISKFYVAGRLEWTTEAPTQEGWYWHFAPDARLPDSDCYDVLHVVYEKDALGVWHCGNWDEFITCEKEGGYWLGPLPVPENPE